MRRATDGRRAWTVTRAVGPANWTFVLPWAGPRTASGDTADSRLMVADAHLPLAPFARRGLLIALTCALVVAAMMLSASGASARTRICPQATASIANQAYNKVQHAGVCLIDGAHVGRHLPARLPGRTP